MSLDPKDSPGNGEDEPKNGKGGKKDCNCGGNCGSEEFCDCCSGGYGEGSI